SPGRLCGRRYALHRRSIREPSLFRERHDRPCSQSPAASRETSTRTLVVLYVLLYSPLRLRLSIGVNHIRTLGVRLRGGILNTWGTRLVERRIGRVVGIFGRLIA